MMKNKTLATWLAFLGGPLGLHRFYLRGWSDPVGWTIPVPTALGLYGLERLQQHGLDDVLGSLLVPLLGFTIAGCALTAIVYGLMSAERWNARFNPEAPRETAAGQTGWLTIAAVTFALLVGATLLISSIVFSFQRYFEYQIEASRQV